MHLQTVRSVLATQVRELQQRLDALRRQQVPPGQARLQRDQETHALSRRIATLTRLGGDVCLGRMDRRDGTRAYVGRLGLRDADGNVLLVDWRTPEAEPFFAATMQSPLGLVSRRRFRWCDGRVVQAWDEWLDLAAQQDTGLPDAQSAFLATLAASRTGRMTSALATIQVDQDAIVRADTRGCTVVDGGPGTGKTVVALHRAAYVAFSARQEVLYVTPHARLASYVSDVLPALGEQDVPVATLEELYAERATRRDPRPELVRLKGDVRMIDAVARAVAFFEGLPAHEVVAQLPDGDVVVRPQHWRQALASCGEVQHEPRRAELLEALAELLDEPLVANDHTVAAALAGTWPGLTPANVVRDLLTHRALLAHCAPWLSAEQRRVVREDALQDGWHLTDLPLLDLARQRLGAAAPVELPAGELAHRREAVQATVSALREAADGGNMLFLLEQGHPDLLDTAEVLEPDAAPVAPPLGQRVFGHVVIDEAQDLTAVEWQVVCSGAAQADRSQRWETARSRAARSPKAGSSG